MASGPRHHAGIALTLFARGLLVVVLVLLAISVEELFLHFTTGAIGVVAEADFRILVAVATRLRAAFAFLIDVASASFTRAD